MRAPKKAPALHPGQGEGFRLQWDEQPQPPQQLSARGREEAPWEKGEAAGTHGRTTRRLVSGVNPTASRVTWDGYGKRDPHAALCEPLGMSRPGDADP